MNAVVCDLLDRCRAAGLSLVVEGDALHVDFECEPSADLIEKLRQYKPEVMDALSDATLSTTPRILRDGRVMWRFRAGEIPTSPQPDTAALLDRMRRGGVVLVGDGSELHIVERWKGQLHPQTLQALKDNTGAAIAVLRDEHRERMARLPTEQVAVRDRRRSLQHQQCFDT
jgi:hypothetical protein